MATVRPRIFKAPNKVKKKVSIRKIDYSFEEKDSVSKIVKVINTSKVRVNLEDAKIIVAGGRGVGSRKNFKLIEDAKHCLIISKCCANYRDFAGIARAY